MTSEPISRRLRDLAAEDARSSSRVRDLLRRYPKPELLSVETVEAIHDRLLGEERSNVRHLRPVAILAAAAGITLALYGLLRSPANPIGLSPEPATAVHAGKGPPELASTPIRQEQRATAGKRAVPAFSQRSAPALSASTPAGPGPSGSITGSDSLARESRALGRALSALRRDRDAQAALVALDRYAVEFPRGTLAQEANVARVDALLALGRRGEARELLERLPLETLPRSLELRLIRAELRAAAGDCAGAASDFDRVLASNPTPGLAERVRAGQAQCQVRAPDAPRSGGANAATSSLNPDSAPPSPP